MKRHQIATAAITLLASLTASAADLELTIDNIDNTDGKLMLAIFNSEKSYDSDKPIISILYKPNGKSVSLSLPGLAEGKYAVRVMHDENNNNKLDTNLLGIPSESYGFSNNAGSFGPASYKDAAFSVTETTKHVISLK